jgi:hypothetical protein
MSRLDHLKVQRRPAPPDAVPAPPPPKAVQSPRRIDQPAAVKQKTPPAKAEPRKFYCGCVMPDNFRCAICHLTRKDRLAALALKRQRREAKRWFVEQDGEWRFPTGTTIGPLSWDGQQWTGTLYVPAEGGGEPQAFAAVHTSVERLIREFKAMFMTSSIAAAAGQTEANPAIPKAEKSDATSGGD